MLSLCRRCAITVLSLCHHCAVPVRRLIVVDEELAKRPPPVAVEGESDGVGEDGFGALPPLKELVETVIT